MFCHRNPNAFPQNQRDPFSSSQSGLPTNGRPFTYPNGDMRIGYLVNNPITTQPTSPSQSAFPQHVFVDETLQANDDQCCNGCGWRPKYKNQYKKQLPPSIHKCVLMMPNLPVARFTALNDGSSDPTLINYTNDIAFADVQFFFCHRCKKRAQNIMLSSDHLAMGSSWPELQEQVIHLLNNPSWDHPNAERWMLQSLAHSATSLIGSSSHIATQRDYEYSHTSNASHASHTSHIPPPTNQPTPNQPTPNQPTPNQPTPNQPTANTSKPPLPPPSSRQPEEHANPTTESNPKRPTISPSPSPGASPNLTYSGPQTQTQTQTPPLNLTRSPPQSPPQTQIPPPPTQPHEQSPTQTQTPPRSPSPPPANSLQAQLQQRRKSLNTAKPEEEQQQQED